MTKYHAYLASYDKGANNDPAYTASVLFTSSASDAVALMLDARAAVRNAGAVYSPIAAHEWEVVNITPAR